MGQRNLSVRTFSVGSWLPFGVVAILLTVPNGSIAIDNNWNTIAALEQQQQLQHGRIIQFQRDFRLVPLRYQRSPAAPVTPPSVCDGLCKCTQEQIFLNVVCDFTQNKEYNLGDEQNIVPATARTFHVNLGANAQLNIRRRAFQQLNRISIDGGQGGGRQQIDFGLHAFHGNRAPFPEINLRHAATLKIHGNAFQGDFKLIVANVENVVVMGNGFQNTSFIGHFSAVKHLRFETDAFRGTRDSQIEIVDSNVEQLERMDAKMREIKLQNCHIAAIKSNTFDVVSVKSIVLDNCDIDVIEGNFTTSKLLGDYLGIVGCRIQKIRSQAIANSAFSSMDISGNKVDHIEPHAISAVTINFTFAHNEISHTGAHWLNVQEWSAVGMVNNSFGLLSPFEVLGNGKTCHFSGNSITRWTSGSLASMAETCRFQDNVFNKGCTCSFEWLHSLSPNNKDLPLTSYCQIENLMNCFNATTFNVHKFSNLVCGDSPSLDCKKTMAEKKVEGNFLYPDAVEGRHSKEWFYYIGAFIAAIIVLVIIVCLILRMRCHNKSQRSESQSPEQVHITMNRHATLTTANTTTGATMSKGVRSFSGHDRAIVDLAMEKLRLKHPSEVFEQVDNYTRKLMTEQLSETEKVLTIGEIVRILDECENIGDDFLAFTDLLYRHLDENSGQTAITTTATGDGGRDPLYAEPGVMVLPPVTILDSESHIYAEPSSAQQPLLKTEYSSPIDRSEHATNVYADPVEAKNDTSARLVSPYAIGNTAPVNLPDVLSRSVPTAKAVSQPALPPPKLNTFGKNSLGGEPGPSRGIMPTYSVPQKSNNSNRGSPCVQRMPLQQDNSSSSSKSSSHHSGGSDITFKIDDIIDYVDN